MPFAFYTGIGNIGINHRTICSHLPIMIMLFCLVTFTSCLVKRATQSSSHNWENDISMPLRSSRTIAAWVDGEKAFES